MSGVHFTTDYWANYKEKAAARRKVVAEAYQKELEDIAASFDNEPLRMAEEILSLRHRLSSAIQDKAPEYSWRL